MNTNKIHNTIILSLYDKNISYDVLNLLSHKLIQIYDINKKWNKIYNKLFYLIFLNKDIKNLANAIHNIGYKIHNIAREFHNLDEGNTAIKIHRIGKYYHSIGSNLLYQIHFFYINLSINYKKIILQI